MNKTLRNLTVGLALGGVLATGAVTPRPAAANTTTTLAIGAAALIGGLILYNNYQHKRQAANDIVGYTRNGGAILGDGRIVMPNGQTFTPNAYGQYPTGQYAYYAPQFQPTNVVYDYNRSGVYDQYRSHDNGRHLGWYKNRQAQFALADRQRFERQRFERDQAIRQHEFARIRAERNLAERNRNLAERNRIENARFAHLQAERGRFEHNDSVHRDHDRGDHDRGDRGHDRH
jgi:hypothetical protein